MDVDSFLAHVRSRRLFDSQSPVFVSRAPGRLDVMGGIADYSGSLVLQRPIAEATFVAAQRLEQPLLQIDSFGRAPFALPVDRLAPAGVPIGYQDARQLFDGRDEHWAAYVAGLFLVL